MEDLIHVIYVSAASPDISEHDTVKFLNEARKINRRNDVSGLMLYMGDCFLLLLEGEATKVGNASGAIFSDKREMRMLLREAITEREFPNGSWVLKPSSRSKPPDCLANRCGSIPILASPASKPKAQRHCCPSLDGAAGNRIAAACSALSVARPARQH